MGTESGRIEFMSTQRREDRWQRTTCTACVRASGGSGDWTWLREWNAVGHRDPAPVPQAGRADASGVTASPSVRAWLATNSLQLDPSFGQLVQQDIRLGLPPARAGSRAATGVPATRRLSLLPISIPPGFVWLHLTPPQAPAATGRWTERQDGKRDLYFQHAA